MFTAKGKERAVSLTGSTIITVTILTVLIKNIFLRMKVPDSFSGDRKKFKAYELQCRMYL